MIRRWLKDRRGATAIEYAMIGSLIAVVIVGALRNVGSGTNSYYGKIGTAFTTYIP